MMTNKVCVAPSGAHFHMYSFPTAYAVGSTIPPHSGLELIILGNSNCLSERIAVKSGKGAGIISA